MREPARKPRASKTSAQAANSGFADPMTAAFESMEALRAPGAFLLALEGRAPIEFGATLAAWPWLRNSARGDGHAVIVFPGLAAGDFSTVPLRNYLAGQGYDTYGWELGLNFGPRAGVIEKGIERVQRICKSSGRKVSLIGWSLGGIYAREFAKAVPDAVRSVITLGTPFAGDPKATNAWRLYEFASGHKIGAPNLLNHLKAAPPVPTTSIFSRTDGVVAWPLSLQHESRLAENIEVVASHIGLGMNPAALHAVADRLSQPEGAWAKFDREGWRRWVYRDPNRDRDSIL